VCINWNLWFKIIFTHIFLEAQCTMSDHYRRQRCRFVADLSSIFVNPVPQSTVSLCVRGAIKYVTYDGDNKLSSMSEIPLWPRAHTFAGQYIIHYFWDPERNIMLNSIQFLLRPEHIIMLISTHLFCRPEHTLEVCPKSKCTDFLFKCLLDSPEITSYSVLQLP